ncbi:MAG TPA: hypothetical protein EYP04_01480, partial [Anaerolineae bacterium]|nr:hypothetical protein [Anaerolineae bacterium]
DTTYLTYVNANPASDDNNDDGQIDWSDLTVSFGSDLAPGQKFTVYVFFTAKHTTESLPGDVTTNYATTHDVVDENGDSVPDDDGSADVEITHPEVQVTKTLVDPANGVAAVGDPVQYRIDIYNSGDTRIDVLPLDDNFDTAHLDFVSATPAESSHSEPAGTIHWNDITAALGNLNPGQTHTIYVNFVAMASSKPDHVNNTAIVSGATDENGDDVPDDQDSDDTLIVTAPGLEVTKTLVSPTSGQVLVGDPVQFKIEIENTGNTTIVLLPLQDTYNTNCLSYVGATPQSDDNNDDGQINWSDLTAAAPYGFGSDLAPGQKFTVYVNFTAAGACNPATNLGSVINAVDENGDLLSDSDDATVVVVAPASIGDYVWYDDNDNGVQDEPAGNGINGVTVDLYWDSDNNGSYETHVGQQTTANYPSTGNPGWYDFTHLWPGDYRVDVTDVNGVLATYRLTTPPEPLDVSVSAGEDYNDADFGYVQDFHDWDYDCQENTIVDVIGDGMMNNNPQTVVIPDPGNVTRMIVQVVVKKSHGYPYPDLVQVTTPLQNFSLTYPTSMSSGSYLYELEVTPTTQVTAQVSGIHGDSKPKALVVYVFRTTTMPQISVGHTLNEFVYHSSHVEVINIPPLDATSDVTVTVAIADNEDDPRPLTVKAEAGGVVEQITFQTPNMGDELDIRSVVLPNVPMGTSVVTVTEISPYPSPDGDSSIWTGVDVDTYCASCSIGDRVWDDVNANGAQDDGATGIQNVDIKLYRDDGDGSFNPSVDYYIGQQTTMGDGFYDFLNLAPGTYHVDVQDGTVPAGYTLTTPPEPRTVALPPNTDYNDADFGYYQPGRIGDYVWNDINGNGLQDEGAGYGLNNVLVNLWQDENNNDVIDGPDVKWQTTTTSGDGWYEFAHLPPDNYIVEIDGSNFNAGGALDGYYFIPGSESGPEPYPYDLAPAEVHLDADFGYAGKGTISGIVWYDWDEDGVQDLGEDGIPGVDVCLYYDDGTIPGQLDPNDTPTGLCDTTNSPDGDYAFPDVLPGEYLVVESQPSGYESTTPDVIPVTLIVVGPSGNAPDKNFGEVKYASLGNYAWVDSICSPTCGTLDPGEWSDLNHNGEQDPGEPGGIPNVQMTVDGVDVLGRPVHIITYTDSNGYYLVDHLVPGTYTVTVATPSGYVRTSPSPLVTTLGPGDEDLDIDFGFISPTAVDLQEFTAEAGDGAIVLRWRTLVETNNIGFHVWRATHYKGPYQRITTKPVPSSASDGVGAEYLYTDTNVKRGVTYWYKLETVPDGQIFGPVSITWDDPGPGGFRVFVPFISR